MHTHILVHIYFSKHIAIYDHAHDISLYTLCYAVVSTAVLCALYLRIDKVALALKIAAACIADILSTNLASLHHASTHRLLQAKQHPSSLVTSTCTAGTMLQYHYNHNKHLTSDIAMPPQHSSFAVLQCWHSVCRL
jgi:hypothetical protein